MSHHHYDPLRNLLTIGLLLIATWIVIIYGIIKICEIIIKHLPL